MGANRQFQAETAKYENRNISKTINRIKTKFEDQAQIKSNMAAGRHLKNGYDVITRPPIDQLLRNLSGRCDIPTTKHTSKSKPEIGIQHGGRPFSDTGTSFISAVDWDFSPKFGTQIDFHLLKWVQSPHLNPEVDFRLYGSHLENRQDVITPPLFVWLLWHLAGRCKMTCRWLHMGPYWNRK